MGTVVVQSLQVQRCFDDQLRTIMPISSRKLREERLWYRDKRQQSQVCLGCQHLLKRYLNRGIRVCLDCQRMISMIFLSYRFLSIVYLISSNHATYSNKYTPLEQRVSLNVLLKPRFIREGDWVCSSYVARTLHCFVFREFRIVIYGQGLHGLEQEYLPLVLRHRWNVTSVFEWVLRDRKQIDEMLLGNSLCHLANINCSVVPTDKARCFAGSLRSNERSTTKAIRHFTYE